MALIIVISIYIQSKLNLYFVWYTKLSNYSSIMAAFMAEILRKKLIVYLNKLDYSQLHFCVQNFLSEIAQVFSGLHLSLHSVSLLTGYSKDKEIKNIDQAGVSCTKSNFGCDEK